MEKALEPLRDKKIVYTGGVFDLFHYGHLNYLQRAKELGDVLVVHVNGDEVTRKTKRLKTFVVEEDKRAMIVASLSSVDMVIIYDRFTGDEEMIKVVRPDAYVRVIRPQVSEKDRLREEKEYEEKYVDSKMVFLEASEGPTTKSLVNELREVYSPVGQVTKEIKLLINEAKHSSIHGYSYSGFKVGVSILDEEGNVYTGANISNSSPSLAMCAERVAIQKAVSRGSKKIRLLVLYTNQNDIVAPCGLCRQVIYEFSDEKDPTKIILVNAKGDVQFTGINKLLPLAFKSIRKK